MIRPPHNIAGNGLAVHVSLCFRADYCQLGRQHHNVQHQTYSYAPWFRTQDGCMWQRGFDAETTHTDTLQTV